MEISNIVEILEMDVFQKAVQAEQPFMTAFQVCTKEMHVFGQLLKQRPRHFATHHSNLQIRILYGQIMYHGHGHGNVA